MLLSSFYFFSFAFHVLLTGHRRVLFLSLLPHYRLIFWPIMPIGIQLCLKSETFNSTGREGERRRVCDRICSGGGHCRRRRRWTVHRFPGVAAASKKVAEVGGGGMEKELKSLSEPAREIKDFQAIEQLNSRESGHLTPLEPVLTAVSGWREGGMDGCVRGQI